MNIKVSKVFKIAKVMFGKFGVHFSTHVLLKSGSFYYLKQLEWYLVHIIYFLVIMEHKMSNSYVCIQYCKTINKTEYLSLFIACKFAFVDGTFSIHILRTQGLGI
jgi:hypothetical protein